MERGQLFLVFGCRKNRSSARGIMRAMVPELRGAQLEKSSLQCFMLLYIQLFPSVIGSHWGKALLGHPKMDLLESVHDGILHRGF